ncbi:MAG: PD-(D/E)XK nuclease family protein [Planctomycetes bacterium]|nr:PD-(D/E)XK nuclease family protein [Planctomycetota bacterium]
MSPEAMTSTRTSYSRMSTWLRCPRKFKFRYVDLVEDERTAVALIFGTSIHEACEVFFRSLPSGNAASLDEMLRVFTRALTDNATLADEQGCPVDWGDGSLKDSLAKGEAMLAVFHQQVDRNIKVVGTEVEFEVELAPGVFTTGVIDLILDDGGGHYRVVDLKTAATTFAEDRILHDMQPTVYIAAAERIFQAPGQINFEFWLLMKTKTPALKILPLARDARDRAELIQSINEVGEACIRGVYPRIRGHHCFGCEYADRCGRA